MENEDGIGPVDIEFAESLVGQGDRTEADAAVEHHLAGRFGKGEKPPFHQQGEGLVFKGSVHCRVVLCWLVACFAVPQSGDAVWLDRLAVMGRVISTG